MSSVLSANLSIPCKAGYNSKYGRDVYLALILNFFPHTSKRTPYFGSMDISNILEKPDYKDANIFRLLCSCLIWH